MMGSEEMRTIIRSTERDAVMFLDKTGWLSNHDRAIRGTEPTVEDAELLPLKAAEERDYIWLEVYDAESLVPVQLAGRSVIFGKEYVEAQFWSSRFGVKYPTARYGSHWRIWDKKPSWELREKTPWVKIEDTTGWYSDESPTPAP